MIYHCCYCFFFFSNKYNFSLNSLSIAENIVDPIATESSPCAHKNVRSQEISQIRDKDM